MDFTYAEYGRLLETIRSKGYSIDGYNSHYESRRTVILRHDVDVSLEKAVDMAKFEGQWGAKATYFILISSDFYNVFSRHSLECIEKIMEYGHEIGLHFDEKKYFNAETWDAKEIIKKIIWEKNLLEEMTGIKVNAVSMHTPSAKTLEADLQIPGLINSYSQKFFKEFRYISDSFHRWRDNVWAVVEDEKTEKLHILTHAFWYNEESLTRNEEICKYIENGTKYRYKLIEDNILPPDMKLVDCFSEKES
ncbi:MAG: hypothetical protein HDQ96_06830 [Lachnospiraceae bacterium]|nr:hypothetical protein [Lachnospiraceae bacterium]